jgi:hypothetical protein
MFMLRVLALFLAYLSCQIWALAGWAGNWRLGALLPALAMAAIISRFVIDVNYNPTSHNLWPFEVIIWSIVCLGILGIIFIARKIMQKRTQRTQTD